MSQAAQAVARAVREMEANRQHSTRRRTRMDDEDMKPIEQDDSTDAASALDAPNGLVLPANEEQKGKNMAKKKSRGGKQSKKVRKSVAKTKSRRSSGEGRARKTYQLVKGIPDTIRNPSVGRSILEVIEKHGSATRPIIRADLPKAFKEATLNAYLGQYQRDGIVKSK